MCGIAAVLGPRAQAGVSDPAALGRALARRGPDSADCWSGPGVALWASRLALWDQGAAAQPYVAEDAVGCFNGELFNLEELWEVLGLHGASEVEVLTRGVLRDGPDFLRRVDGQFAGVVVDRATGTATLFRDRFGICPLYVAVAHGTAYAASDLQALGALAPGVVGDLSLDGLAGTLCEWAAPAPLTTWSGVRLLEPGRALTVRAGEVVLDRPWAAHPADGLDGPGPDLDDLLLALEESVRDRTRSTGTTGVTLSGGIDSTIVAALAVGSGVVCSFGLVVPGDHEVERRQRDVADRLGLHHRVHVLTPAQVLADLVELVSTRRVPLVRLGAVGMMGLARFVRASGVTSVLCGEGADELFSGYDSYRVLKARSGAFGPVGDLDWEAFGSPEFGAGRGPVWAAAYWRSLVALSDGCDLRRDRMLAPVLDLLGDGLGEAVRLRSSTAAARAAAHDGLDALDRRRDEDLRGLLASYLLVVQGDHAWMEEGVEQRPAWLSNRVAAWALARPAGQQVGQAQGKLPVRALLGRLVERRPELAGLDFDKAAFRVDACLLLGEPTVWDDFTALVAQAPSDLVDVPGLLRRARACARAGRCSEQESMVLTFAASLGVLAGSAS